jgi:hypothetical protein
MPRTEPEMTSDSSPLVRVTPAPNSRQQNASSVSAASVLQLDQAHRRVHRRWRLEAVAAPWPIAVVSTLAADPAQELVDLGLDGGLHQPTGVGPFVSRKLFEGTYARCAFTPGTGHHPHTRRGGPHTLNV